MNSSKSNVSQSWAQKLKYENITFANVLKGTNSVNDYLRKLNEQFWAIPFTDYFVGFAGMYFVIIGSLLFFYQYAKIRQAFSMDIFVYAFLLIVLFLIIFFVVYPQASKVTGDHSFIAIASIIMIVVFVISFIITTISSSQFKIISYFLFAIIALIIIIGLAICFYLYSNYLQRQQGVVGFIVNFIFFIPCLLIDLIEFIQKDLGMTSRTIYILLFIETVFITLYFAYPVIYNNIGKPGIKILPGSRFLNKPNTIVKDTNFLTTPDKEIAQQNSLYNFIFPNIDDPGMLPPDTGSSAFKKKFSISMWIYLNTQTSSIASHSERKIFSYGNGKPSIYYINNTHVNGADIYRCYFTEDSTSSNPLHYYETSVPGQKWNHFVFNYNSNEVDLFINGILVKHMNFSEEGMKMPEYTKTDTISVGSSNLNGAICNITYTQDGLTKNQIITEYNLLMNSNPPLSK